MLHESTGYMYDMLALSKVQKTPARNSEETMPMDSARGAGGSSKEIQAGQYYKSVFFVTQHQLLFYFFFLKKITQFFKTGWRCF